MSLFINSTVIVMKMSFSRKRESTPFLSPVDPCFRRGDKPIFITMTDKGLPNNLFNNLSLTPLEAINFQKPRF